MILTSWTQFTLFVATLVALIIWTIPSNLQMGSDYFDSYEYDKAYKYFSRALKKDQNDLQNLKRLKNYFLVKGETEKAMKLQEKLVLLKPQNLDYIHEMERLYDWNLMPYDKFKTEEKEVELLPKDKRKPLLREIAEGYRWLKKYEDANRVYEKLLHYNDPETLELAVGYYLSTKQTELALKLLHRLGKDSRNPVYHRWIAEFEEAKGRGANAIEYYEEILSKELKKKFSYKDLKSFDSRIIERNLGFLQKIGQNLSTLDLAADAEKLQRDLIDLFPQNQLLQYDLAYSFREQGEVEKAREIFRRLEGSLRTPEKIFDICELYADMKLENEANRCLRTLTQKHPGSVRYLRALGESYERLGEKRKALEIYEAILRLNGEAMLFREFYPMAQLQSTSVQSDAQGFWPEPKPRKKKILQDTQEDELRLRVLSLKQDLGQTQNSDLHFKKLILRHPNNVGYRKQLGFWYFDQGRSAEGLEVFKEVLRLSPQDTDALFALAEQDLREGKPSEAYAKIRETQVYTNDYQYSLKEEILFGAKKTEEHQQFCLTHYEKSFLLSVHCDYHLGHKKEAISRLEDHLKDYPSAQLRNTLIVWSIEDGNLRRAQELMGDNPSEDLRKYYQDMKSELQAKRAWVIETSSRQVFMRGFSSNTSSVDLLKKLSGPGVGTTLETYSGGNRVVLVSPYAFYGIGNHEVRLGPTFFSGEKKLNTPFFSEYRGSLNERLYLSLRYDHSRPEYQLKDLANEQKALRNQLTAFASYHEGDRYNLDLSLSRNDYRFQDEKGSDHQFYGEYLRQGLGYRNLSIGARVFHLHLNSNGSNIKRLHLDDALAYFAVIQYGNAFLRKGTGWSYLLKGAIGGDEKRAIKFGHTSNYRAQLEHTWSEGTGLQFYSEYYNESYLALVSNMTILGLNFFSVF